MRIWITKGLQGLIDIDSDKPVKVLEEGRIKINFLREALPREKAFLKDRAIS